MTAQIFHSRLILQGVDGPSCVEPEYFVRGGQNVIFFYISKFLHRDDRETIRLKGNPFVIP